MVRFHVNHYPLIASDSKQVGHFSNDLQVAKSRFKTSVYASLIKVMHTNTLY